MAISPDLLPNLYWYKARICLVHPRDSSLHPVYDADGIWYINWDLGDHIWRAADKVRLARIDALELSEEGGTEARDYTRDLFPPGHEFLMRTYKPIHPRDSFGRYLIDAYLSDGTCFNDRLVERGYAVYKDY